MTQLWPNLTKNLNILHKNEAISLNNYWIYKVTSSGPYFDLIIRCQDGLRVFKYDEKSMDWNQILFDNKFSDEKKFGEERHKINFFTVNNDVYMVFLSHNNGFVFVGYNPQKNEIQEVLRDRFFIRAYNQLHWGYFYGTQNPIGLFAIHEYDGISCHYVNINSKSKPICGQESTNKFLKQFISSKQLDWDYKDMNFCYANVKSDSKTNIICQSNKGLKIYELIEASCQNEKYFHAQEILHVNMCSKNSNEKFWFATLTGVTPILPGSFKNLIVLNSDGMYVFEYNVSKQKYCLITYSSSFSEQYGWDSRFNQSIMFQDYDNCGFDKLIYTGPNGLRIEKLSQISSSIWYWKNIIDFQFSSYIGERYMLPMSIIPSFKSPIKIPVIIGQDLIDNKPIFTPIETENEFEVIEAKNDINENFEIIDGLNSCAVFPSLDNTPIIIQKSILSYRDTLDINKLISSSVSIVNGSATLSLPLVKLQCLKDPLLRIDYSSNSTNTSVFGQGWNMHHELIYTSNTTNTCRYTYQYYLISGSSITPLLCIDDNSDADIRKFEVKNDKNVEILYNLKEEYWKVVNLTEGYTFIYGGGINTVNSRGNGIEWQMGHKDPKNGLCSSCAFKWYLTYFSSKPQSSEINYHFKEISTDDTVQVTKGIYLEKISMNNNETNVILRYKSNYELVETVRLETLLQVATINFNYKFNNKIHLLESISQFECNNEKILQFSYDRILNSMKLVKLVLPDGNDCLSFSYEASQAGPFDVLRENPLQCQNASKQIKLASSVDYLVVSELLNMINEDLLKLHVYNKVNYENEYQLIELSSVNLNHKMTNYEVYTFAEFFIVYFYSHNEQIIQAQAVYLYHRNSNCKTSWLFDKVYCHSSLKMMCFNAQAVAVILNDKSFVTIEWNNEKNKWYESFKFRLSDQDFKDVIMTINEENTILVYGDESTRLIYKDLMNKWKVKQTLNTISYIEELRIFTELFDIKDDIKSIIFKHLKQNLIHFTQNVILFNRLFTKNHFIYSTQTILMIDSNLNLAVERELSKTKSLMQIECKRDIEFENKDKIEFYLTYAHSNDTNKYKVVFKKSMKIIDYDFHNKEYKRIYEFEGQNVKYKVRDHHGDIVKGSEQNISVFKNENDLKSFFFVDLDDYFVKLRGNKLTRGKEKFEFDGRTWTLQQTDKKFDRNKIEIGEMLSLGRSDENEESTWKLMSNGEVLFDFKTKNVSDIVIVYPSYIAYKAQDNTAWILVLNESSSRISNVAKIADKCDYVISGSNQYLLAIKCIYQVYFYPNPADLSNNQFELAVVKDKQVKIDNVTYLTGYDFRAKSFSTYRSVCFLKCFTYPAKMPNLFGYIEHDMQIDSALMITYYDSNGQIVKKEDINGELKISEENDKDHLKPVKRETVLFASDQITEIIEFYNVNISDDEADYYGFESYEPSSNKWQMSYIELVKGCWPLMGNTFLRLKTPDSSLSRVFKPKNIEINYECSCWIRLGCDEELNLNEKFEEFSVFASSGTFQKVFTSQIVSKYQDWIFLRIVIDVVEFVKANKLNVVSMKVEIRPSKKHKLIDVDHIKWLPFNNRYQLNVYDEFTKHLICTMKENNRINRLYFDVFYQPFAILNSDCQLQNLTFSYNKTKSMVTVEASNAIMQTFSDYSFKYHWIMKNSSNWKRNGEKLSHCGTNVSRLTLTKNFDICLSHNSLAVYFCFELVNQKSAMRIMLNSHEMIFKQNNVDVNGNLISNNCEIRNACCFILAEGNRLIIWLNSQIILDRGFNTKNFIDHDSNLTFDVQDLVNIHNILILNEPRLNVDHMNSLRKVKQTILLESDKTIVVTERLYDQLEREAVVTKSTRVPLNRNIESLAYLQDFVTNRSFNKSDSFWKTGELCGIVSKHNPNDENYCYYRNLFANSPTNDVQSIDYPGKTFSSKHRVVDINENEQSNKSYLYFKSLFPSELGFSQRLNDHSNGNKTVTFFDKNNNKVAIFNHTLGYQDILTTYDYDEQNNLVKILPPLYHSNNCILTLEQIGITYDELKIKWQSDSYAVNLQTCLANKFLYNKQNLLIESYTPESGKQLFFYNKLGFMRFSLKYDRKNEPYRLEYLNYNSWGEVAEKGFCENKRYFNPDLLDSLANSVFEEPSDFRCLHSCYTSSCIETGFNGKEVISKIKTDLSNIECKEVICYTHSENVTQKEVKLQVCPDRSIFLRYEKHYAGSKISSLLYPLPFQGKLFNLIYKYNKHGLVSSISYQRGNNDLKGKTLVEFSYTPSGLLCDELFYCCDDSPQQQQRQPLFNRQYEYNSAEFLKSIKDCFQNEYLSYYQDGYGNSRYYDGTIVKTKFEPNWNDKCDPRLLCLCEDVLVEKLAPSIKIANEEARYLLGLLVNKGYLDKRYRVVNELTLLDAILFLPVKYGEETIKLLIKILNSHFPSKQFGHRYSYGNFMELVNAKYFIGNGNHNPISIDSFVTNKIDSKTSKKIWDILLDNQFIFIDSDETNCTNMFGKIDSQSWVDTNTLDNLLTKNNFSLLYTRKLAVLLQIYYSQRIALDEETLSEIFKNWNESHKNVTQQEKDDFKEIGKQLWRILAKNGYFYSNNINARCSLFKPHFYDVLSTPHDLSMYLPDVVKVLCEKASEQIGTSSCDLRCLEIDENGNHRLYRNGFDRFELKYSQISPNQVTQVTQNGIYYTMDHDNLGNVITAEHKGILKIGYDPVSGRAVEFTLNNGYRVLFNYDSHNERVYKCVLDKMGKKFKEIFYLSDQKGRTLVEKEVIYDKQENIENESLVAFIYGPRGLLGYIKEDEFYHVLSDHEQSVRLIIKNNVVVAAFDYSPYGNLIREIGVEAKKFRYRFTGQEWDPELRLYNYHARFYDPDIGRFYQTDAKDQYASPYKYAGNSPVSFVDQDGNEAVLLVCSIVFACVGAYLGGAAANDDWRFWKWEFNRAGTWFGIIVGGVVGFLMPHAFILGSATIAATFGTGIVTSTFITCGLGAAGLYLSMSIFSQSFHPKDWNWKKPGLWNSVFQGFASGVSLPSVLSNWHQLYTKYGYSFLFLSMFTGVAFGYLGAASANNTFNPVKWKWKQQSTYLGFFSSAWTGFFLIASIKSAVRANNELFKNLNKIVRCIILLSSSTTFALLSVYVLYESIPEGASLMTLLKMPNAYEVLINGALFGYGLPSLLFKTIPDAWKGYKSNSLFKDLKAKLYKHSEELTKKDKDAIEKFINDTLDDRKQRFQTSVGNLKKDPDYLKLTPGEKQSVDDILNQYQNEINNNGRITSNRSTANLSGSLNKIEENLAKLFGNYCYIPPASQNASTAERLKMFDESVRKLITGQTKSQIQVYQNLSSNERLLVDNLIDMFRNEIQVSNKITSLKTTTKLSNVSDSMIVVEKNLVNIYGVYSNLVPFYSNAGCYCVMRLDNGKGRTATIICHSSSKEIYNVTITENNQVKILSPDTQIVPNKTLAMIYDDKKLIAQKWAFNTSTNHGVDPKNCAEFRAGHIIAAYHKFTQNDIVSITAFRANNMQLQAYLRCPNCQVTYQELSMTQVPTDITGQSVVRNVRHIDQMLRGGYAKMFYQEIQPMLYIYHIHNLTINVEVARNKQKKNEKFKKD